MLSLPVFFVRNIFGNFGQIAAQYAAKLIQRAGAHAAVFSQPVKLPRAEIVVLDKPVLRHTLFLHGCPQPVKPYHFALRTNFRLMYIIVCMLTIARIRAMMRIKIN